MKPVKREKKAIIICYPLDWHWGISLEFLMQEEKFGNYYDVIDASFVGLRGPKVFLRRFLFFHKFQKACKRFFRENNFNVISLNSKFCFLKPRISKSEKFLIHEPLIKSPSYNTIVEKSGLLDYNAMKKSIKAKKIIRSEIKISNKIFKKLLLIDLNQYSKVVTVNGRFNKNATVVSFCNIFAIDFSLIENGIGNSYVEYKVSPHSMEENQTLIDNFWRESIDPFRTLEAKKYLSKIIDNKTASGVNFRSKMVLGNTPLMGPKKSCVYYASSEYEYAGIGDPAKEGHFANQVDAFRGILQALDPEVWDIYLRMHPLGPNSKKRHPENFLWDEFTNTKNLRIIPPNSDVDSLSLGAKADLIASFGSTILIEFIARGFQNVVTLGPSPWNRLVPSRHLYSRNQILEFISSKPLPIKSDDILPWAFYTSNFGQKFRIIEANEKTGKWSFKSIKTYNTPRVDL